MEKRVGFGTKLWFGFGQSSEGMKNTAFATFLLLFYSQVLGLDAGLAGLVLGIALIVDAVTDPMTGSLSDAFQHRWGRRHPFMYAAAIPMWITFALAFRPPEGMGQAGLFVWMLTFTILARLAMTLYHVPHLALGAELSTHYDERTSIVAYRNFFGLLGSVALLIGGRQLFFIPTEEFPNAQLDASNYPPMALAFGGLMAFSIFASALGTHSVIPTLPVPKAVQRFSFGRLIGELREALGNGSFFWLFTGVLLFFVARGVASTLDFYMGTFFWGLETRQVFLIPLSGALGLAIGTPFWVFRARGYEKRSVFIFCVVCYSGITFALPLLKILGVYPPITSPLYTQIIYGMTFAAAFAAAGSLIVSGSMMADIADEHERDIGRRQEGIFFGALSFSGKAATGIGSLLAGIGLSLIAFPKQVAPELVPPEVALQLGILAGPGVAGLMFVGAALMFRYDLSKERVAEVQAELERRRASERQDPPASRAKAS